MASCAVVIHLEYESGFSLFPKTAWFDNYFLQIEISQLLYSFVFSPQPINQIVLSTAYHRQPWPHSVRDIPFVLSIPAPHSLQLKSNTFYFSPFWKGLQLESLTWLLLLSTAFSVFVTLQTVCSPFLLWRQLNAFIFCINMRIFASHLKRQSLNYYGSQTYSWNSKASSSPRS